MTVRRLSLVSLPLLVVLACAGRQGGSFPHPDRMTQTEVDDVVPVPAEVIYYYLVGLDLEEKEQWADAAWHLERAVQEGGRGAQLFLALCESYLEMGEFARAEQAAAMAVREGPDLREAHQILGRLRLMRGDLAGATTELEAARDADPIHFGVRVELGLLYHRSGRDSLSLEELRQASDLSPPGHEFHLRLAELFMDLEEFDDARTEFERALEDDPSLLPALEGLAGLADREGDLPGAVRWTEEALLVSPGNLDYMHTLFMLKLRQRDGEGALEIGRQILAQVPEDAETALRVAGLLIEERRLDEAEKVIDGLKERPEIAPNVSYVQGRLAWIRGDFEKAAERFEEALAKRPDWTEALTSLSYVSLGLDDVGRADSLLTIALQSAPENPEIHYLMGIVRLEEDRPEDALGHLRKSLELRPEDERAWFELGVTLERLDRLEESVEAFKKVLEINPESASSYNYIGYMYAERGIRLEESKTLIEEALAREPDNAYFIDSLGWLNYRMGNLEKATEALERAASLVEDAEIRKHLAEVYESRGMINEARRQWGLVLELDPDSHEAKSRLKALGELGSGNEIWTGD